jgi:hypothetical protein
MRDDRDETEQREPDSGQGRRGAVGYADAERS